MNFLDSLMDESIPGGCDDCNAYSEMTKDSGIYVLTVRHDDTCPELARRERKGR